GLHVPALSEGHLLAIPIQCGRGHGVLWADLLHGAASRILRAAAELLAGPDQPPPGLAIHADAHRDQPARDRGVHESADQRRRTGEFPLAPSRAVSVLDRGRTAEPQLVPVGCDRGGWSGPRALPDFVCPPVVGSPEDAAALSGGRRPLAR